MPNLREEEFGQIINGSSSRGYLSEVVSAQIKPQLGWSIVATVENSPYATHSSNQSHSLAGNPKGH